MPTKEEHYQAGLKLFGEQKHGEAIAEYRAALELEPEWTEGLHALSMAQMHAGQLDEAIETGKKIVELDKNDPFAHTSLSMFYMRKGMIDDADKEGAKSRMRSGKEELKSNPNAAPPGPAGSLPVQE